LGQLENVAQVAQIGQSRAQHNEQIWWARRSYLLDTQSVRLDALDHAKEEIKSHYDTYVGRIDTLLLVLALIFPFALNVIQFSDPFVPTTAEACPDCIESEYKWLVWIWACLIGVVLVLPFWGILMLIRCKLRLDKWLEISLAGLHAQRTKVVAVSRPSQSWLTQSETDETARAERDEETEQIVYKLVTMVLGYQEYLATQWNDELGQLVWASTALLWLSASAALLLTALSMWIFLVNKGDEHTVASYYFAAILSAGLAVPVMYMAWRGRREEVKPPNFTGVDAKDTSLAKVLERRGEFGRASMFAWQNNRPTSPRGAKVVFGRFFRRMFSLCAHRAPGHDDRPPFVSPRSPIGSPFRAATEPLMTGARP